MVDEIAAANNWLWRKYKVKVPAEWLEACIQWIHDENQGSGRLAADDVHQQVYDQWLICDLRDIGAACLPSCLAQQPAKYQLSGVFQLQMNSIVDVGSSYYSQLQKLEGTENENVGVTASTQQTQMPWEAKPSRLLMMKLTDGEVEVAAMEYQPIAFLNAGITPGTKVLVTGSILCRLGVLMLTRDNITILGGEVDTLMEEAKSQNILAQRLQQSEELLEKPPEPQRVEFTPQLLHSNNPNQRTTQNSAPIQQQPSRAPQANVGSNRRTSRPIDFSDDEDDLLLASSVGGLASNNQASSSWVENEMDDDDILMSQIAGMMEPVDTSQNRQEPVNTGHNRHEPVRTSHNQWQPPNSSHSRPTHRDELNRVRPMAGTPRLTTPTAGSTNPEPSPRFQTSPPPVVIEPQPSPYVIQPQPTSTLTQPVQTTPSFNQPIQSTSSFHPPQPQSSLAVRNSNVTINVNFTLAREDSSSDDKLQRAEMMRQRALALRNRRAAAAASTNTTSPTSPPQISPTQTSSGTRPNSHARTQQATFNDSKRSLHQGSLDTFLTKMKRDEPDTTTQINDSNMKSEPDAPLFKIENVPDLPEVKVEEERRGIKRSSDGLIDSASKQGRINDIGLHTPPFTYLSSILASPPCYESQRFDVKCYISTIPDKLSFNRGQFWSLGVRINDGSASVEVDFSDQLITSIIRHPAREITIKEYRQEIQEGKERMRDLLVDFWGVMTLEVSTHKVRPTVVSFRSLSQTDVTALTRRLGY